MEFEVCMSVRPMMGNEVAQYLTCMAVLYGPQKGPDDNPQWAVSVSAFGR